MLCQAALFSRKMKRQEQTLFSRNFGAPMSALQIFLTPSFFKVGK